LRAKRGNLIEKKKIASFLAMTIVTHHICDFLNQPSTNFEKTFIHFFCHCWRLRQEKQRPKPERQNTFV
jgi:hypothetical protein